VPGVISAAEVDVLPLSGASTSNTVWPEEISGGARRDARFSFSGRDYFRTMEISLLSGRDFSDQDTASSRRVAIVNQSLARQLAAGANPIGKHFRRQATPYEPETSFEIVGLVKDTKYQSLRDEATPIAFVAIAQNPESSPSTQLVIRYSTGLPGVASGIRNTLAQAHSSINVDLTVFDVMIRDGLMRDRLLATLSGFFGVLAALIAAVGLYGVMSYTVVRRTNEIGLRIALGANRGSILSIILRQTATLLAVGLAAGTLLSWGVTGAAESMLFGLKSHDVRTMLSGAALLTVITFAASYLPARRAARLDPMKALREE
jgi:predicted permease